MHIVTHRPGCFIEDIIAEIAIIAYFVIIKSARG